MMPWSLVSIPPAMRTNPFGSKVADGPFLIMVMLPMAVDVPVSGS